MESPTCKKELIIEVPEEVVAREAAKITGEYARVARIPGFRPGHAPRALVGKRYREEIRGEVVQSLVPKYFEESIRDQKFLIAGEPRFEDLQFEDGQPIRAKATFEVYPEIELKDYKGLEVEEDSAEVTSIDVEEALERLRQNAATFEVIEDRPAADGDYVMVSYQGEDLMDSASEPIEVREGLIHLGGKGTVPAFTENLRDSRPGDVREFEINYPDDFPTKRLAGKRVRYRVEVQSIKQKVLPPVDDELAKSVSDFSTLADLREDVRKDLERKKQSGVKESARRKLFDKLTDSYDFPVPETVVEAQLRRKLERAAAGMAAQGVDPRTLQIDWRELRDEMRVDAEREVRGTLVLQKIAEAENIDVSDEEIDEAVRELAQEVQETPAALKSRLTREDGLVRLKSSRLSQKVLDFIYNNAKITPQTPASSPLESENSVTQ
ncbi:MAG TPA: trigger factor [Terriglobia bacterium]|nr:trigger factor [Terriglobia bacterium]